MYDHAKYGVPLPGNFQASGRAEDRKPQSCTHLIIHESRNLPGPSEVPSVSLDHQIQQPWCLSKSMGIVLLMPRLYTCLQTILMNFQCNGLVAMTSVRKES